MAMDLIYLLEVIDVAEKNADNAVLPACSCKLTFKVGRDCSAIPRRREYVVSCFEPHVLASFNEFVLEVEDANTGA
jgi:hypothetical protein